MLLSLKWFAEVLGWKWNNIFMLSQKSTYHTKFVPHVSCLNLKFDKSVYTKCSTPTETSPVFPSFLLTRVKAIAAERQGLFSSWWQPHLADDTWARDEISRQRFSSQTIYSHFMEPNFLSYCAKSMARITILYAISHRQMSLCLCGNWLQWDKF